MEPMGYDTTNPYGKSFNETKRQSPSSSTCVVSSCSESEEENENCENANETIQDVDRVEDLKSKTSPLPLNDRLKMPVLDQTSERKISDNNSEYIAENHVCSLDSRITKLESSIDDILELLKEKQDQNSSSNTTAFNKFGGNIPETFESHKSSPRETTKVEREQNNDPQSPKSVHASIEYRSYSPNYEEGLRREIQSRSRSNTIDSHHNSVDSEKSIANRAIDDKSQSKFAKTKVKSDEILSVGYHGTKIVKTAKQSNLPPRPPLIKHVTQLNSDENNATITSSIMKEVKSAKANQIESLMKTNESSVTNQMTSDGTHFSLRNYIKIEMLGEGMTQTTPKTSISIQQTDDRMQEFLKVPFNLEKLLFFGLAICIDSYLYVLTFLPINFLLSVFRGAVTLVSPNTNKFRFHRRHMYQLLQVSIIYIVYTQILSRIQIGVLYHWIRGQAMLKLYVFIAIVEVFDRLMCAFGQDAQDSLYWNATMNPKSKRLIISWLVVLVYASVHSLILFVHVATLNVAMNSADQALLSLLVGGNFAEIKSTVFKKYNKMVLFNITMSDTCERFKLGLFLTIILLLNISQGGVTVDLARGYGVMCGIVFAAEVIADWIKHAFITKLNFIESKAYKEYALVLARDFTGIGHEGINLNHTHAVVKRVGFAQFPLVCVMARYLKEAARYTWMRSDKTGLLQRWFCHWKYLFAEEQVCIVENQEWNFQHSMMLFFLFLILYISLLSIKIIFGFLLQLHAREKLLNDLTPLDHDIVGGNASGNPFSHVKPDSNISNKTKPKRQII